MKDRLRRLCGLGMVLLAALAICAPGTLRVRRSAEWASAARAPAIGAATTESDAAQTVVPGTGPTVIDVSDVVLRENAQRLGVNLGGQTFYDSLQTLKNLIVRNPGFEGEEWRSVGRCGKAGRNSCTGGANSSAWPDGFLDGGTFEVISGAAEGETGTILHSTAGNEQVGSTIQFSAISKAPAENDYLALRKFTPGDAAAGWDTQATGGATVTTEYKDLSLNTPGRQALRIEARGPGQSLALKTYFDTTAGRSFVQLRGPYTIRFRAKLVAGSARIGVTLQRLWAGAAPIFSQDVPIEDRWRDYTFRFMANEPRQAVGAVMVSLRVDAAEVLIDDVSVAEAAPNGTPFRGDVVAALQRLRPGVLRYMDSGQNFGSSLDNMLAPDEARERTGFNLFLTRSEEIPLGLNDFLVLCEKIHADPWYTMQIGWSPREAEELNRVSRCSGNDEVWSEASGSRASGALDQDVSNHPYRVRQ